MCLWGIFSAYISSYEHLLGHILAIPFVTVSRTILPSRKNILKIRFQESLISQICQLDIWISGNFMVNIEVSVAIFIQKQATEGSTVGHVDNLTHFLRQRKLEKVSNP